MQEDFSKHRNEFRKGSQLRKFNEDPTYLSWFFMFDYISHESPLFNGAANQYLENVVGGEYGKSLSNRLSSFIKLFQRINKEMPWFWQTLGGVEVAMQYQNFEEPFWGANKPKLEIDAAKALIKKTLEGEKRSTIDNSPKISVPKINPNCTEEVKYATAS